MVDWLLERSGNKPETLEDLHRSAFNQARTQGLNYEQMAVVFNEKRMRREKDTHQPWTSRNVQKRWFDLNRLKDGRQQREAIKPDLSESVA